MKQLVVFGSLTFAVVFAIQLLINFLFPPLNFREILVMSVLSAIALTAILGPKRKNTGTVS